MQKRSQWAGHENACALLMFACACTLTACGPDRSYLAWDVVPSDAARADALTRTDGSTQRDAGGADRSTPITDANVRDAIDLPTCAAPRLRCGADCVDPRANALHCGDCDVRCPREEACVDGACVVARRETGSACTSDGACDAASGACILETSGFPGGYCIYGCRTNTDCPGRGYCATTASTPYCLASCTSDTECRSGYACLPVSETTGVCYPRCSANPALVCGAYRCDTTYDACDTSPCSSNFDCSSGSQCDTGTARCRCTAATNCGTGFACVVSTGRCGCASDSVCGSGRRCDATTGRCTLM